MVRLPCVTGMLLASANWLWKEGLANSTVIKAGSLSRSVDIQVTVVLAFPCTLKLVMNNSA